MAVPAAPETVEVETGETPRYAVIWMHGSGADGHGFVPIVPELRLPANLPVRFVFPHAPLRPVTINAGMVMRAWYDVFDLDDRRDLLQSHRMWRTVPISRAIFMYGVCRDLVLVLMYGYGALRLGSQERPTEPEETRGPVRQGAICVCRSAPYPRRGPVAQFLGEALLLFRLGGRRGYDRALHLPRWGDQDLWRGLLAKGEANL